MLGWRHWFDESPSGVFSYHHQPDGRKRNYHFTESQSTLKSEKTFKKKHEKCGKMVAHFEQIFTAFGVFLAAKRRQFELRKFEAATYFWPRSGLLREIGREGATILENTLPKAAFFIEDTETILKHC